DRSWSTRLTRKLRPLPYYNLLPRDLPVRAMQELEQGASRYILLNNSECLPLAPELKRRHVGAKIVYLSHGAEIVDAINNRVVAPELVPPPQRSSMWLGELLEEEIRLRSSIDGSVCISEQDAR